MPSAERQARLAENRRQQAINEGVGQVNAIFGGGREAQLGDFLQALRDRSRADLGDQQAIVDRQSKFNLARRGVIGGSSEQDTQRRNRKALIQAIIGSESRAQSAVGRLRQQDESTRQNLLNLVFGGLDASTAAQRASSGLRANVQAEQDAFVPQALSSLAGAGAQSFSQGIQNEAFRRGSASAREALFA